MLNSLLRAVAIPAVILMILLAGFALHVEMPIAGALGVAPKTALAGLGVFAWIAGAVLVNRLIEQLFWRQIGRRSGRTAPHLLVQLSNTVVYFAAAMGMASLVFKLPLTGAIATSSVIGIIIGFAVKSLISDTFSGIALNLDQGFSINDFIQVIRPGNIRLSGRVTQINWRSTYIMTPENSVMVIPNTVVSESVVINFSKPEPASEFEQVVTLDFEVPSDRAVRVLNAAVHAAARENDAIYDCKARVSELNATGVTYKIKYMLNPAKLGPGKAKHLILSHVARQMTMTGLALAHPKVDNWRRETPEMAQSLGDASNRLRLLSKVSLFRDFANDNLPDLAALADRMALRLYAPGSNIITAGAPGQSMFILSEGLTAVRVKGEQGEIDVASLSPGDFFGEMSLLTGEPRSASIVALTETVAFEIDKDDLLPLLDANPQAAELLAIAVADRRMASAEASSRKPAEVAAERASVAGKILNGMMRFLGVGRGPVGVTAATA